MQLVDVQRSCRLPSVHVEHICILFVPLDAREGVDARLTIFRLSSHR